MVYATATMQIQRTQHLFTIAQTLKHVTPNLSNDDPPKTTTFQAYASWKICQKRTQQAH
jgi:hypothetical protein